MRIFNKCFKRKKIISIIVFMLSLIYIILYLRPSLVDFDENYTLNLIHHGYSYLIYLDSLDVHPPLYYILLKLFVDITTGWSSYLPLKIFSARMFSLLISIIMFIFLRKITLLLHISHNIYIQWVLLIILPNVLGFKFSLQQLIDIRMYSLSALFVVVEFYYLLKFYKNYLNRELVIATICAILASYTHYYSAMFCGILLLLYFINAFIQKNKTILIKIGLSGIIFGISFLPWMPVFLKQISNSNNYWMTYHIEVKQIIIFMFLFMIFLYPFIRYAKSIHSKLFNIESCILISVILFVFIFSLIYSILRGPIFQYRYMFPILIIYEFIGSNILLSLINNFNIFKRYFITLFIFFGCLITLSVKTQIFEDKISLNSIRTYNIWRSNPHTMHIVHENKDYDTNYISYMSYINGRYIIPKASMKSFQNNSRIYNNHAYRILFKKDIKEIKFQKKVK